MKQVELKKANSDVLRRHGKSLPTTYRQARKDSSSTEEKTLGNGHTGSDGVKGEAFSNYVRIISTICPFV